VTTDEFILHHLRDPKLWVQAICMVVIGWVVLILVLA